MPYQLSWYQEDRILLYQLTGDITLDDLEVADGEIIAYMTHKSLPVYLLVDVTRIRNYPLNIYEIKKRAAASNLPNHGGYVVVGAGVVTNKFINAMGRFLPTSVETAPNMNEAVRRLKQKDPSLGD